MATLDFEAWLDRDDLAVQITNKYMSWKMQKAIWEADQEELTKFLFATDTRTTSNAKLPWQNSTTIPKLTQIRDNLHANYMAALFPTEHWLKWRGEDKASLRKNKRDTLEAFMHEILRRSGFRTTISRLVYDYIDYGNAFGEVQYVKDIKTDPAGGEDIVNYVGPRVRRISPFDIVFDATSLDFDKTPTITRYLKSLGELKAEIEERPDAPWSKEVLNKALDHRRTFSDLSRTDKQKAAQFRVDGFGSLKHYYQSGYVEVLEFEGDLYDAAKDTLYKDHIITVIDRSYIARMEPRKSWLGKGYKRHVGWRLRPDNLWAMGPLDNLVGMQYRIDHLENMKSDVFDKIAHPRIVIRGEVEDFSEDPMERIYTDEDGDVTFLHPPVDALNADTQMALLEQHMEELAGAPKEAMGIRTPGEKTAFEVQSLQSAAGRIFQNKVSYFEEVFLEPLANAMFEMARRELDTLDIPVVAADSGYVEIRKITRQDVTGKGKFYPIGARHFAAQAQMIQNLNQFANSPLAQDPAVMAHISPMKIAALVEEALGLAPFDMFGENIRLHEEMETARLQQQMEVNLQKESLVSTDQDISDAGDLELLAQAEEDGELDGEDNQLTDETL